MEPDDDGGKGKGEKTPRGWERGRDSGGEPISVACGLWL